MKRIRLLCFILVFCLLAGCQTVLEETFSTALPVSTEATQVTVQPSIAPTVPETTAAAEPSVWIFDPNEIIQDMTLEEKVGQLFLARCPSTGALEDLQSYHLGGYILFGRDFDGQTPDSLRATLASYQGASKIPMLIAVDEEGGTVARVSACSAFRSKRFPSPRDLYSIGGMELVLTTEAEKCQLLSGLGINVNMAPVCDITTDPSAFMYKRSLGESPEITGQFVSGITRTMAQYRIGSVLKHFPGYGNNADTHTGIAVDSRSLQELEVADLLPFAKGIESGCNAILVSHTIVSCLDDARPASVSPAVHDYLRKEMRFDGVIVTDDLAMDAIIDLYGDGEAAVLAVLAGNDLLCATNYRIQYAAVLEAVQCGRIPMQQLESAVARILLWKHELGLLPEDI